MTKYLVDASKVLYSRGNPAYESIWGTRFMYFGAVPGNVILATNTKVLVAGEIIEETDTTFTLNSI